MCCYPPPPWQRPYESSALEASSLTRPFPTLQTVDDLSAPLLSLAASRAGTRSSVAGIDLAPRSGDLPPISVRISDDLLEATANGGDPGVALDASQAEAAPQADVPAAAAAFETRGVSGGPASPARQPIFGLPSANVAAGKGPDALPAEFYTREGVPERLALVASRNAGVSLGRRNYAHRLSSASVFLNFNAGADPSVSGSPAIAKGSPLSGPSSSLASAPVEAASPEEAPIDDPIEQDSDAHLDEIIAQLTESVEADNSPPVPNEPSSPTPVSRSASTLSNLSSKSSFASSNELLAETATAQESEADEADLSPPMSAPTPPVPDSGSKEVEQPALSPAPSTEQLAPLPEPAPVAGTVSLPPPIVTTAPEDQAPIIAQALPLFNPFAPFAFGDPPADTSALVEVPGILRCAFVFVRCADLPAVQTEEALSESLESSGRARVCYAWDIPNDATVQMIREEARRVWAAHRANPAPVESTPVEADDEVDPGDVVLRFANTHGLLVELFDGTQLLG
ncbi:hypothetical protein H696_01049 [Fonticula alba]|uniref:Uncharacterized protein n=1 Tax=Fonticula alba TaxID=691883 RepID=A0A058ZCG4_FONAL|nr:hypothetical protein H696_01049 [Fonticula alba]KCV71631.1 hypothetical protein H696_01049 [Fonticula alba]|eukprot:XP_009493209.1 hypothetical protein H696_01049 [Fonticula alba]